MSDGLRSDAPPGVEESSQSALSWAAIFAGGIGMAALALLLATVGAGVGLATVSPWPGSGVSATTFEIATGIYLIVIAMLSSTVGGYIAGRLRTRWVGVHSDEVLFRDTAHGFLAWAFAAVIGAAAFGAAATVVTGGAAQGASQGAARASQTSPAPMDYSVDLLLRPGPGTVPVAPQDLATTRTEVRDVLVHDLGEGKQVPPEDRAYLAQVVAARTGLNAAEADKKVGAVIDEARAAVDNARKAAAAFSLWLAASMLIGAFSASLAAIEGGQLRDGRWRGVIGARNYQLSRQV
jgi:hypothetical protein